MQTIESASRFNTGFPEPTLSLTLRSRVAKALKRNLAAWFFGLLLLGISITNYLINLNEPAGPVWDEGYYLTATARYAEGRPQFASHPPLGLMLLDIGDRLAGANRGVDLSGLARVKAIGNNSLPPRYNIWGFRLSSAAFGVALVVTVYLLLLSAGIDVFFSAATAQVVALETAFIVQFRAAQLDAFEVEFAVVCVGLMVVAALRRPGLSRRLYFAGAGAAAGAAAMVKLDGVLLIAAPVAVLGSTVVRRWRHASILNTAALEAMVFTIGALVVVASTYTLQTLWCDEPLDYGTAAAAADARFVSPTYQHYLDGRLSWSPNIAAAAAGDSVRYMLNDQAGVGLSDSNGSSPWLQPLGLKSINYRWDSQSALTRYVQLIANPVNWATSAMSLIAAATLLLLQPFAGKRRVNDATSLCLAPIASTALVFYVAHGMLGAHRVMYLYHAFISELLGLLCLPFLIRELIQHRPRWLGRVEGASWSLLAASALAFLWFAPLVYHRPLTHHDCELRNWPMRVVVCRS